MRTHRGKPQHQTSSVADNLPGLPATAPNPRRATGAGLSLSARSYSPVELESVEILRRICVALDARNASGHSMRPIFRTVARRWRGSFYRSAPSRRVQMSAGSLRRIWYGRWLRGGRTAEALHHRYGLSAPKFKLSRDHRCRVRKALQTACTLSEFRALVFNRCRKRPSMDSVRRCFSAEEWLAFSKAFMARRQARAAEARFAVWLKAERRTFNPGGQS